MIGRAIIDGGFRKALLADPVTATRDYNLSEFEVAALATIRGRPFDRFAARVDQLSLRRGRAVPARAQAEPDVIPFWRDRAAG
jgi:hypothetical protein